jgi:hypothetical protein
MLSCTARRGCTLRGYRGSTAHGCFLYGQVPTKRPASEATASELHGQPERMKLRPHYDPPLPTDPFYTYGTVNKVSDDGEDFVKDIYCRLQQPRERLRDISQQQQFVVQSLCACLETFPQEVPL